MDTTKEFTQIIKDYYLPLARLSLYKYTPGLCWYIKRGEEFRAIFETHITGDWRRKMIKFGDGTFPYVRKDKEENVYICYHQKDGYDVLVLKGDNAMKDTYSAFPIARKHIMKAIRFMNAKHKERKEMVHKICYGAKKEKK